MATIDRRALLIAGPTASGKSALALALADRLGAALINADSMQVYRDLRIITARPTPEEEALAEHRLYGTVDGAVNFSVGRWLEAVEAELDRLASQGRMAIVIGGTGLYFKALTEGLSDMPAVPETVRATVRAAAEGLTTAALHERLTREDPETAAGLRREDRQRILRAMEVKAATGRPLKHFQGQRRPSLLGPGRHAGLFLAVERATLRERIDRRFETMMAAGALDEVARLNARALDPALPVMRAHGVPGLIDHLAGGSTLDEAIARGQRDTRAYAKRQETWFRHQMPGFVAVSVDEALERGLLLARSLGA